MSRFLKSKEHSIGIAPGEGVFIGVQKVENVSLSIIDYNETKFTEISIDSIDDALEYNNNNTVTWLNIYGLHDVTLIKQISSMFSLHPLTLEDILNTALRPKMEEHDDYIFLALKMMRYDLDTQKVRAEQLSAVMGENYLITFQERPGDVFEPVRNRLRKSVGRIRKKKSDYLAYALLDIIMDNYLHIISTIGEKIEELEDEIIKNESKDLFLKIYTYKREFNYLRKSIGPVKDFSLQLSRLDSKLIDDSTLPFYKDLLGLSTHAVEISNVYRGMLSDHFDFYNSGINNRLNEIMKVLTIFSVVFIPLTFIAGIYGTNFEYLPELKYKYSYFIFWGVLVVITAMMLLIFKRKKWF